MPISNASGNSASQRGIVDFFLSWSAKFLYRGSVAELCSEHCTGMGAGA
jgi:hypothetical protein